MNELSTKELFEILQADEQFARNAMIGVLGRDDPEPSKFFMIGYYWRLADLIQKLRYFKFDKT